jgi:hypothetical protein
MIQYQALERGQLPRREVRKVQFVGDVTEMILPDNTALAPRPQAFLVEQSPNWTLPPHFHEEHQFQVFVQGSGSLGTKPVQLLAVHYASPHTGYGPLISGAQGISYLTLRAVGDTGAWYLPESRERNLRIPKSQAHGLPTLAWDTPTLQQLPQADQEVLIEPRTNGLAAWLLRLGPNQSAMLPDGASDSGGRFLVVAQGGLRHADTTLPPPAVVWMGPSDNLELRAADHGLALIVLQFPREAAQSFVESHPELKA